LGKLLVRNERLGGRCEKNIEKRLTELCSEDVNGTATFVMEMAGSQSRNFRFDHAEGLPCTTKPAT
jgi:hypothetical protein